MSSTPIESSVAKNISFLRTEAPEIFQIQPRPGGIVSISPIALFAKSSRVEDQVTLLHQSKLKETVSREFKVQNAIDNIESDDEKDVTSSKPVHDAMFVFGVTITTLIMMASKHPNIPKDSLAMTKQSLDCIEDEYGHHPPNVQGILNQLKDLIAENDRKVEKVKIRDAAGGDLKDGLGQGMDMGKGTLDIGAAGENIGGTIEKGGEDEKKVTVRTTMRVTMDRRNL